MAVKQAIGLALGSGGLRGLSHIGALEALQDNDITITHLAGTSIGAIIGAFYARDLSTKPLKAFLAAKTMKVLWSMFDPAWSGGLVSGDKVRELLKDQFGDLDFSDLKLPFAVCACDLQNGEVVTINTGKLADAVYASMAIPTVFKPTMINGRQLVDGGLANPVPDEIVRQLGAKKVVSINLDNKHYFKNPEQDVTNLSKIAHRSSEIMFYHLAVATTNSSDLIIEPDLDEGKSLIGWKYLTNSKNVEKVMEAGYRTIEDYLPIIAGI